MVQFMLLTPLPVTDLYRDEGARPAPTTSPGRSGTVRRSSPATTRRSRATRRSGGSSGPSARTTRPTPAPCIGWSRPRSGATSTWRRWRNETPVSRSASGASASVSGRGRRCWPSSGPERGQRDRAQACQAQLDREITGRSWGSHGLTGVVLRAAVRAFALAWRLRLAPVRRRDPAADHRHPLQETGAGPRSESCFNGRPMIEEQANRKLPRAAAAFAHEPLAGTQYSSP